MHIRCSAWPCECDTHTHTHALRRYSNFHSIFMWVGRSLLVLWLTHHSSFSRHSLTRKRSKCFSTVIMWSWGSHNPFCESRHYKQYWTKFQYAPILNKKKLMCEHIDVPIGDSENYRPIPCHMAWFYVVVAVRCVPRITLRKSPVPITEFQWHSSSSAMAQWLFHQHQMVQEQLGQVIFKQYILSLFNKKKWNT